MHYNKCFCPGESFENCSKCRYAKFEKGQYKKEFGNRLTISYWCELKDLDFYFVKDEDF